MSILVISGSQRRNSQSLKVSKFVIETLKKDFDVESELLDLCDIQLPWWTDHKDSKDIQENEWVKVKNKIDKALGYVFVVPEWNGGLTAVVKNFFYYCNSNELADKAGYIITVTSSYTGGNYPALELRMGSSKNTQICYVPEHLHIRSVSHVLNSIEPVDDNDSYIRARLQYGLNIFLHYTSALTEIRAMDIRNFEAFPYGM